MNTPLRPKVIIVRPDGRRVLLQAEQMNNAVPTQNKVFISPAGAHSSTHTPQTPQTHPPHSPPHSQSHLLSQSHSPSHPASDSQFHSQSLAAAVKMEKADWQPQQVSTLIEIAGPEFARNKKCSSSFWINLTETLNCKFQSSFTADQCRNKFFALNGNRRSKISHNETSGNSHKKLTDHEEHLHDIIHKYKDPIELPAGEEANCSSSLETPEAPSPSGSTSTQLPVAVPHSLKRKMKHGTGSRQAATRNGLREQWMEHMAETRKYRESCMTKDERKLKMKEDAVEALNKKNAIESAKLLIAKEKLEFKKSQAERANKMLEVEKEKVDVLKSIKAMLENYQLLNSL